jgi:hypothetical protein
LYEGWKICTYNRKISKAEESTLRNKLKTWFDSGDWSFSTNTHRIVISYGPDRQEINVSFQETKCDSEEYGDAEMYQIVFSSIYFGFRGFNEKAHQELYKKTISKIPWKKQGFWLQDNAEIPILKNKRLRVRCQKKPYDKTVGSTCSPASINF